MTRESEVANRTGTAPVGTVGFAGLGVMGAAMAARLLESSHDVSVFNRSPRSAEPFGPLGATIAATPAELAARCGIVLSCLLDTDAVRDVYLGEHGFVRALRPGAVFVEHGTFDPELATELAATFADAGAHFIDMPVTGGPDGARQGTLTAMAGGDAEALERVRPVVRAYAGQIEYAGPAGNGLRLKLVNQLLVTEHLVAAAEAAALIQQMRIPSIVAERVLGAGWAQSAMLTRSLPKALRGDFASSGATLGGLVEVQRLVAKVAAQAGVRLRTFGPAAEAFQDAQAQHYGDCDPAALVRICLPDVSR